MRLVSVFMHMVLSVLSHSYGTLYFQWKKHLPFLKLEEILILLSILFKSVAETFGLKQKKKLLKVKEGFIL